MSSLPEVDEPPKERLVGLGWRRGGGYRIVRNKRSQKQTQQGLV